MSPTTQASSRAAASSHDRAAFYLAGIFDGEGHVRKPASKTVVIDNTDEDIIRAAAECLLILGIDYRLVRRPARSERWKPITSIYIYGRGNLELFAELVPLRAGAKREALRAMLAGYGPRPPTREVLERMYVEGQMTTSEIATALGAKPSAIVQQMRRYGIPTRTMAETRKIKRWGRTRKDAP